VLERLVDGADALVESFRPGVMDRLGVGYGALSARRPSLVYVAITGYGQDGPYRDRPGHDLNYIGYGGALSMTGPPDGGSPVPPGVQVGDLGGGGMLGAIGLLAALVEARTSGRGRFVDVSMLDGVVSWLSIHAGAFLATGVEPSPGVAPLGQSLACYRVYRAADGRHLTVAALEPKFWEALCLALGLPEFAARQFDGPDGQREMVARIQSVFDTKDRAAWLRELEGLDACVGPVNSVEEALQDPQVTHRSMVAYVDGQAVGPGPVPKLRPPGPSELAGAPGLGEHTEQVLLSAGFTDAELAELRTAAVI
jgi:crotonobetainyl-CoA:carnitine CoA-transferase CaiB-like acyl-CoA transferase